MHGCQNCILHVRRNNSREIWCWGKSLLFFITFEIQSKTFGVFDEKFRHGGQKPAFHVKRWSFQEWTNLSNKAEVLIFFGNSIVKFTEFGDYFMHGCQNCILHVQTNKSKKIGCLGKSLLFLWLLNFNQNLFGVLAKKYGTVVKTAFHVNGWSFQERTKLSKKNRTFRLFWEFDRQIYGVWWQFMHGCQNCILHVQTNNSRKICCFGIKFTVFITFEN